MSNIAPYTKFTIANIPQTINDNPYKSHIMPFATLYMRIFTISSAFTMLPAQKNIGSFFMKEIVVKTNANNEMTQHIDANKMLLNPIFTSFGFVRV